MDSIFIIAAYAAVFHHFCGTKTGQNYEKLRFDVKGKS